MEERWWPKVLANAGGAVGPLAVSAVALVWFTPNAWSALGALTTPMPSAARAQVTPTPGDVRAATGPTELAEWSETANLKPIQAVIKEWRAGSLKFNKDYRDALTARNAIKDKTSVAWGVANQKFLLAVAKRNSWEMTWFDIGVPGANPKALQRELKTQLATFAKADTSFMTFAAQEVKSGSISNFTPPF